MRFLPLILLAGCMTDPNGDTCAWAPGNDGYCPSSGSSSKPPHTISYVAGAGVAEADHVRIAMTRTETGEKTQLETAVFTGVEPEHTPVLLDGEPMHGTNAPQLAAIDDRIYLAWGDQGLNTMVGAPLYPDGTVVAEEIVNLGARTGTLRRVGDRFLFVFIDKMEIRGTWIDRDGKLGNTVMLARPSTTTWFDVSNDGASNALAIAYLTKDDFSDARGVTIMRIAADGSLRETGVLGLAKTDGLNYLQVVTTSDGGALVAVGLYRSGQQMPSIVRVGFDGKVTTDPTKLAGVTELARNGTNIIALAKSAAFALDERGIVESGPFVIKDGEGGSVFATGAGFTVVHRSAEAPVVVTTLDASAYPSPPVTIAETEVDGCGCRTTNGHTAGLFVIVFALVLRRRAKRAA